jgi:uncharacterized membrane protein HdeD (DUF308 family)
MQADIGTGEGDGVMKSSILIGVNIHALAERWWVPSFLRGLAAILFGMLALAAPSIGLFALVVTWGAYAIADGVANLFLALRARVKVGWYLFEALVSIGAGLATFVHPGVTAMVLVFLIAGWAVLTGIFEIGAAIELRKVVRGEWMLGLAGVLSIAFGGLLFAFPGAGALAVVWLIAGYAIAFGALLCGLGLKLRRLRGEVARDNPTGGAASAA